MASMAPHLAEVANPVGDLARANILWALMDNRALTAKELACAARVYCSIRAARFCLEAEFE
jgi:hypothetical protein